MKEYKKVITLNNEIEAKLMEEILKEREIPHIIQSYYSFAYGVIFQTNRGWGHIEAESKYYDEIVSIYNDLKSSQD